MEIGFHQFPSGKKYTYIVQNGQKVFLRNIVILTPPGDAETIVIVHEWGKAKKGRWEPPKGQMEWKELDDSNVVSGTQISEQRLTNFLRKAALREMVEESHIFPSQLQNFRKLPLSYQQDWPESKLSGAKFMYVFWAGTIQPHVVTNAKKRIEDLVSNPEWRAVLPKDVCEKDDVMWWNPREGWDTIRPGFSKKMTYMYFDFLKRHGI